MFKFIHFFIYPSTQQNQNIYKEQDMGYELDTQKN